MSGRRSALSSKVAQTDGHSKPGKVAQFAGMLHPDLRPDRHPVRPDDIGRKPGRPGPRMAATSCSRDPSGAERGPAAARRCCRKPMQKSLCVLSVISASMVALQFGISFLSF
jgi:hypothetical protein